MPWLRQRLAVLHVGRLANTERRGREDGLYPCPGACLVGRHAFYYPWFPEAWNQQGVNPFTHYHPSLGFYDSSNTSVIEQHLAAMQYGHIEVGIGSWWGHGSRTDQRIPPSSR